MLWAIIGAIIAWKVAQIALNIAMAANPIGLIILAITGLILLIAELIKHWDAVQEALQKVADFFVWVYETFIKPVIDVIVAGVELIIDALQWLWEKIEAVGKFFADTFGWISDILGGIGGFFGGIGKSIGGIFGFQEGGVITEPTLALLGERGAEAVIPLKNGRVPVSLEGAMMGAPSQDTYDVKIYTGVLPEQETPESLNDKIVSAIKEAKMRGATGEVI